MFYESGTACDGQGRSDRHSISRLQSDRVHVKPTLMTTATVYEVDLLIYEPECSFSVPLTHSCCVLHANAVPKIKGISKITTRTHLFLETASSLRPCGCGNSMLDVRTGLCCCKRVSYESKPLPTGLSTMRTKCRTRQSLSRPIPRRKRDPICKREDLSGTELVCHRHRLKRSPTRFVLYPTSSPHPNK